MACCYRNVYGVPVLFGEKYFEELLLLPDKGGAKPLLEKYADHCFSVQFEEGAIDIDTPQDWINYVNRAC